MVVLGRRFCWFKIWVYIWSDLQLFQWKLQWMYFCGITTWSGGEFGPCVIWELGPPSASEMAADLEMLLRWPRLHIIYISCSTIFTQDGSIYAEWGSYNICTCPQSVCLQSYVQRGGSGIWREQTLELRGATDLSRSSSAGYGSTPCTWHPPPLAVARLIFFETLQGL